MHDLPESARAALAGILGRAEHVEMVVATVGSSLVLTDRRLVVIRDGANFRPTTGVRSFVLDHDLQLRIGPQLKRVIIETTGETINLFIRPHQLHAAEALVAETRRRIHQPTTRSPRA